MLNRNGIAAGRKNPTRWATRWLFESYITLLFPSIPHFSILFFILFTFWQCYVLDLQNRMHLDPPFIFEFCCFKSRPWKTTSDWIIGWRCVTNNAQTFKTWKAAVFSASAQHKNEIVDRKRTDQANGFVQPSSFSNILTGLGMPCPPMRCSWRWYGSRIGEFFVHQPIKIGLGMIACLCKPINLM